MRALLSQPLPPLSPEGATAEAFTLVQKHREWLRPWFAHHAGWQLMLDSEAARLVKRPARLDDASRPCLEPNSGAPLSRRAYVILSLALASLVRADRRTTLVRLRDSVIGLLRAEPRFEAAGVRVDLDHQESRRDFVHALRLLLAWGVIKRVQGEEERFIKDAETDALYNVNRPVLARLLAANRPPSLVKAQAIFDTARTRCDGYPALLDWENALAGDGTLKRLSHGDTVLAGNLLDSAFRVLGRDPREEVLLANFAAHCAGDSHALDRGQPLATLCLRVIAAAHGIDGQCSADARRKAWAAVGVIIDDLSAPVLTFNLRAALGSALEQVLGLHRQQGQPAFLTYRQLQSGASFEPLDPAMHVVFVCENPSVVSAAARELGPRCRPLVCTNGQPASAVRCSFHNQGSRRGTALSRRLRLGGAAHCRSTRARIRGGSLAHAGRTQATL